jgi:vitamin B12 transporter
MNKVLSLALACLLLQTGQVLSAEISTLEPVIVTATRFAQPASQIPASTTVISADQIAASGARDLGEVLRDVVSLDVSSNGPRGATAFGKIRGSSAEQVLVLLDGVRLNSEQNGTFDLNSLPVTLKDIERIEIVRGPASALYGSAASGGVIQIITRKAESKPLTIANWNEGSHDTRNFGLSQSWKPGRVC